MTKFFPVAVWYGADKTRAPMTPKVTKENYKNIKEDLRKIKNTGFNSIRIWFDWASVEPSPGEYNLESIIKVMDISLSNDLKVILQVYLESAPNWLLSSYPDSRYKAQSGDIIDPQSSPGLCFDSPGIRENATKVLQKTAKKVKDHPAFLAWDVWSEPHIVQWTWLDWLPRAVGWFCYCHYSKLRFQKWLKKRYKIIDRLNDKWYRTYKSWGEIVPPKYVTLSTYCDLIEWQIFNINKLAEDLKWRVQTIKEIDSEHIISSHSATSSIYTMPLGGYGNPDDWEMSKQVDIWGTSLYPKHVGENMPLDGAELNALIDATRCSSYSQGKTFWIGELQGGHGTTGIHFGEPVLPEDIEKWSWKSVAKGAKGLNYYAWYPMDCGYENSGFGLVNLDGSITTRCESAGNVSSIITKNMELFSSVKPQKAEVGIVHNQYSRVMLTASREKNSEICKESMIGVYRVCFEQNIPVDFIHIDEFKNDDLNNYKVIFMPFSIMLPEETIKNIKKYVENGGILVAEVRTAWSNLNGKSSQYIPGFNLHELFGCKEEVIKEIDENLVCLVKDFDKNLPLEARKVKGSMYQEVLVPDNKDSIIGEYEDGTPAIVLNSYGKGNTIFIGTLLGTGYEKFREPQNAIFISGLIKWAKVVNPISIFDSKNNAESNIETDIMDNEKDKLLFIFNKENTLKKVNIKIASMGANSYSYARDIITSNKIEMEVCDGEILFRNINLANYKIIHLSS
jgi:beta-galactosidase GanA